MKHPSDMDNQERNLTVAKLVYPFHEWFSDSKGRAFWKHIDGFIYKVQTADYCNRWGDLMPLVIEHGITAEFIDGELQAVYRVETDVNGYDHPCHVIDEDSGLTDDTQIALVNCLILVLRERRSRAG